MINDKEFMKKMSDNFGRLSENFSEAPFEVRRDEVFRIEEQIRTIVGSDPERINHYVLFHFIVKFKILKKYQKL